MCVIVAKRSRLKNSKKDKWFLYKVRDRAYDPKYSIKYNSSNGTEAVFLVDEDSDWTEGVNSKGIMLVSASLQNHEDKTDGTKSKSKSTEKHITRNGIILRQVLKMDNIKDVVDTLVDNKFTGNTFVSDGDKLFVVEIYVKNDNINDYKEQYLDTTDEKILAMTPAEVKKLIMKNLKEDDYGVSVREIKESRLVVRTNHGVIDDDGGYQPHEEGYESSKTRLNKSMKVMKTLGDESHPFEALTILKNLSISDTNDSMNPIRPKGNESGFFSGTIIMCTPTGTLFAVPLYSKFENINFNRIHKERKVHFVLLPKNLPLFESFVGMAFNKFL